MALRLERAMGIEYTARDPPIFSNHDVTSTLERCERLGSAGIPIPAL
jgi:hypothetical protein